MPTDETRPMDSRDGKPDPTGFSKDGREEIEPVSRYSSDAVMCLDDQSRHIE